MDTPNLLTRNQATLKLLFVGALSLAMLIPLFMVRSIIEERQDMQQAAEGTIASRWGGCQTVSGLVVLNCTQKGFTPNPGSVLNANQHLLLQKVECSRLRGFFFERQVHALVTAVLLWLAWLNTLQLDTQSEPPNR